MSDELELPVLRAELSALTRAVDMLGAQLGAKVDQVVSMQVQLVRLQEQQTQSQQAIDRAFMEVRDVESMSKDTDGKVTKALSFVRGSIVVGALLFAFIQWYTLDRLDVIKANSESLVVIERRLSWLEHELGRVPPMGGGLQ